MLATFLIRNHITIVTFFKSADHYSSEKEYYISEYIRRKLKNPPADLERTAMLLPTSKAVLEDFMCQSDVYAIQEANTRELQFGHCTMYTYML